MKYFRDFLIETFPIFLQDTEFISFQTSFHFKLYIFRGEGGGRGENWKLDIFEIIKGKGCQILGKCKSLKWRYSYTVFLILLVENRMKNASFLPSGLCWEVVVLNPWSPQHWSKYSLLSSILHFKCLSITSSSDINYKVYCIV